MLYEIGNFSEDSFFLTIGAIMTPPTVLNITGCLTLKTILRKLTSTRKYYLMGELHQCQEFKKHFHTVHFRFKLYFRVF